MLAKNRKSCKTHHRNERMNTKVGKMTNSDYRFESDDLKRRGTAFADRVVATDQI
jgi:hypothetical protein